MIDVPALVRRNEELRADNISLKKDYDRLARSLAIMDRNYTETKRCYEGECIISGAHNAESNRWRKVAMRLNDIVEKQHLFGVWYRAGRYIDGERPIPWINGPVPPSAYEHEGPVIISAGNISARRGWLVLHDEAFVLVYCDYTAVEIPTSAVRRYFLVI